MKISVFPCSKKEEKDARYAVQAHDYAAAGPRPGPQPAAVNGTLSLQTHRKSSVPKGNSQC